MTNELKSCVFIGVSIFVGVMMACGGDSELDNSQYASWRPPTFGSGGGSAPGCRSDADCSKYNAPASYVDILCNKIPDPGPADEDGEGLGSGTEYFTCQQEEVVGMPTLGCTCQDRVCVIEQVTSCDENCDPVLENLVCTKK